MFVLIIDLICGALLTATLFMLCIHHPVMTELHEVFRAEKQVRSFNLKGGIRCRCFSLWHLSFLNTFLICWS